MVIFFSGTGNSRFVAEQIAELTDDKACDAALYIRKGETAVFTEPGRYIFVAPVYAAAPPKVFMDFIRASRFPGSVQAYFIMTCAKEMSGCPGFWENIAREKGFEYMGTAQIRMPQNYLLFFRMFTEEECRASVTRARSSLEGIAELIRDNRELPDPGMKAWEYLSARAVIGAYYKLFARARAFRVTEDCIGCAYCVSACPLGNIRLVDNEPLWGKNCTHCMACINLCPKNAVEYGWLTRSKTRYKGPYIYSTASSHAGSD